LPKEAGVATDLLLEDTVATIATDAAEQDADGRFAVQGRDLDLDGGPGRRGPATAPRRRALSHADGDVLVINQSHDYLGGVEILGGPGAVAPLKLNAGAARVELRGDGDPHYAGVEILGGERGVRIDHLRAAALARPPSGAFVSTELNGDPFGLPALDPREETDLAGEVQRLRVEILLLKRAVFEILLPWALGGGKTP
jgi:hypothetical protein